MAGESRVGEPAVVVEPGRHVALQQRELQPDPEPGGVLQQVGVPLHGVAVERSGLGLQPRPVEGDPNARRSETGQQTEVFRESCSVESGVGDDGAADHANGMRVHSSPVSVLATSSGCPPSSTTSIGPGKPRSSTGSWALAVTPSGQPLDLHRRHQHLERSGGVAQPGGHVDRRADVVVALEQQGVAGGHADPQRQRRADLGGPMLEVEGEGDGVDLLDRHDHAAVAEPLGDAHAALAGDLADERPERAEDPPGGVVAERGGVVREAGEVDEDERAGDTHDHVRPDG